MCAQQQKPGSVTLIGQSEFVQTKLRQALEMEGFVVSLDPDRFSESSLAIIELPAEDLLQKLSKENIQLLAVANGGEQLLQAEADSRIFGALHPHMSIEEIVRVTNEALFVKVNANRPPRLAVALSVLVRGEGRTIQTTTVDISRGGLFVRSLNPFGEAAQVQLQLLEGDQNIELVGEVVYTIVAKGDQIIAHTNNQRQVAAHPGMAIRFSAGQDEMVDRLLAYATHKSEDFDLDQDQT